MIRSRRSGPQADKCIFVRVGIGPHLGKHRQIPGKCNSQCVGKMGVSKVNVWSMADQIVPYKESFFSQIFECSYYFSLTENHAETPDIAHHKQLTPHHGTPRHATSRCVCLCLYVFVCVCMCLFGFLLFSFVFFSFVCVCVFVGKHRQYM